MDLLIKTDTSDSEDDLRRPHAPPVAHGAYIPGPQAVQVPIMPGEDTQDIHPQSHTRLSHHLAPPEVSPVIPIERTPTPDFQPVVPNWPHVSRGGTVRPTDSDAWHHSHSSQTQFLHQPEEPNEGIFIPPSPPHQAWPS